MMGRGRTCYLRAVLAVVFALAGAAPAGAGFDAGMRGFEAGDYVAALAEWGPAAKAGDAAAQYGIGLMFRNGRGFERNLAEARRWFGRAAAQGYAQARAAREALAGPHGARRVHASTAASTNGYAVHLASFRTRAAAVAEWRRLAGHYADLLGGLEVRYRRVDLGADKGVYYRLLAGPLDDAAAAGALCRAFAARKVSCRVAPPG
ncbi:MAG: SPOR domain-containing protein [Alphaproteobacteria bacterium]